jgi:hypothetical protein
MIPVPGDCFFGHLTRRQHPESRGSQRQLRTATLGVVSAVVATGGGGLGGTTPGRRDKFRFR